MDFHYFNWILSHATIVNGFEDFGKFGSGEWTKARRAYPALRL